jgi:hypothetical protein
MGDRGFQPVDDVGDHRRPQALRELGWAGRRARRP